jgi:hypothetical protein
LPRRFLHAAALLAALLALWSGTASAQLLDLPVEARAGEILVRAEPGMERIVRDVAAIAPEALATISEDLPGLPAPARVEIRLVKQTENLGHASPPGRAPPPWAVGVAYPDLGVVVVAHRRGAEFLDLQGTVRHELAHLALGAALGGRAPRWLDEGFAFIHSSDFSFERARTLTGMAWTGKVIPMHELDRSFPRDKSAAERAYAQAYDFVAFLAHRGRYPDRHDDGDRWAFRDFLGRIAAGDSADQAARGIYNASLTELLDEWYESLRGRYLMVPVGTFTIGVWVLASLLLVVAFIKRRRRNRQRLARWEEEEEAASAAARGVTLH